MIPGIVTAVLLIAFVGGCLWVYSPRRRAEFAAAERLALDEATIDTSATPSSGISP